MTTNEELTAEIKAGRDDLIEQLWKQTEKYIRMVANRWEASFENRSRCDAEDLYQSGYFALCRAVEGYKQHIGRSFIFYLNFCLKTEFAKASGVRTAMQKNDLLNRSTSVNEPLRGIDEDEIQLEDIIRDDGLGRYEPEAGVFLELIDQDFQNSLERAMRDAVAALPERPGKALELCYFNGMTQAEAGKILSCSGFRVSELCKEGIKRIRTGSIGADLREMLFEDRNYFVNNGFGVWKNSGMSGPEREVIHREEMEHRYKLDRLPGQIRYVMDKYGWTAEEARAFFPAEQI